LHARSTRRLHRVEKMADMLFLFGLLIMVGTCATITYALFD